MLIATAGHVDHGKTSLVKALTGVDTDRLPEEKKRGLTIDLGFAHTDLANGQRVSFVDVPGHERFVRNMVAGIGGIDYALLVIAADDGVMPQTIEHLAIIDLLGVKTGAIALTKADRVDAERLADVRRELSIVASPVFVSLQADGLLQFCYARAALDSCRHRSLKVLEIALIGQDILPGPDRSVSGNSDRDQGGYLGLSTLLRGP